MTGLLSTRRADPKVTWPRDGPANISVVETSGRTALLLERFDRYRAPDGGQARRQMVSMLTVGITRDGQRASQLRLCRAVAPDFQLSARDADAIIDRVHGAVVDHWDEACDEAGLTTRERATLWGREFLNEYAFWDQP